MIPMKSMVRLKESDGITNFEDKADIWQRGVEMLVFVHIKSTRL